MELYRGFSDTVKSRLLENHYLKKPRKPKDSHIHVHNIADNWFYENFGVRARSQTIFCTPDIEQAKQYGKPYKISIPEFIDFKLIFSTHVYDFNEIEADIDDVNNKEAILEWLESKSYYAITNLSDLPEEFSGEVMLCCEKYEASEI